MTVSVRPEHVKVGPAADGLPNRWDGRVAEIVFMGSIVRCRLAVPGGLTVTAEVHNDEAAGIVPGAVLPFGWRLEFAVVLRG